MRVTTTLISFCISFSVPTFAVEKDPPESCEPAIEGVARMPSIEVLRAKYRLSEKPVTFAEDRSQTRTGAKFKLDGPQGHRVILKEYPGVLFDWDSANDHLRLKILQHLARLSVGGARESSEFEVNFEFYHPANGSSIVSVNGLDGFF